MQVRGLTEAQLDSIAIDTGVRLVNTRKAGSGFAFTLGLQGELWRRRGHSGRRIAAVCYHGYTAFMQRVFDANPNAVIITASSRYDGVDDFRFKACAAGERNIGSMFDPMYYADACFCEGELASARI